MWHNVVMPNQSTHHHDSQVAELEHERLTSLINSMADGVLATDQKGAIVIANGAAHNILDVNISLIGKPIHDVMTLVDKNNKKIDLKKHVLSTTTQSTSRDWILKYSDDDQINLYISIAPVRVGFGKKGERGYVLLLRDITKEKSLEEERDEFISVISHELRTPVAITEGNIGNIEFLLKKSGVQDSSIFKALSQSHSQITFLSGLINDLATLARAERGQLNIEYDQINVNKLLQDLSANHNREAEAKSLVLKLQLDPKLELLNSSPLYVNEILQNFLTNAIKYTEEGSITISAESKDNGVIFSVSDTGIGISKSDQEKVFNKFFRSEDYRTRVNSGTGLGLYVTKKLAKLIGAQINFNSKLNEGSTFSLYVPNC
jgi:two-component system, OmpR family, phosphate regulon sensor histidine kinase PhoR